MVRRMNFETVRLADLPGHEMTGLSSQLKPIVLVVDKEPLIADTRAMILEQNGITRWWLTTQKRAYDREYFSYRISCLRTIPCRTALSWRYP